MGRLNKSIIFHLHLSLCSLSSSEFRIFFFLKKNNLLQKENVKSAIKSSRYDSSSSLFSLHLVHLAFVFLFSPIMNISFLKQKIVRARLKQTDSNSSASFPPIHSYIHFPMGKSAARGKVAKSSECTCETFERLRGATLPAESDKPEMLQVRALPQLFPNSFADHRGMLASGHERSQTDPMCRQA